jgi:8-hydroxy-5-deazaflavin:NADPH oxidoreductase
MRVGIIGSGRIGGNIARLLVAGGHDVCLSFSREPEKLRELAASIDEHASAGSVRDAVEFGDVVVLSVPWPAIPTALEQAGSLAGKVVIDTTNPFGQGGWLELPGGATSAQFNQERMPGARPVKAFNTLTSGFQASAATRPVDRRAVLFMSGDDDDAKATVARLIEDAGFVAADLGSAADSRPMEAPRRPGALYGEEYRAEDARAAVAALRAGQPLPPVPSYAD